MSPAIGLTTAPLCLTAITTSGAPVSRLAARPNSTGSRAGAEGEKAASMGARASLCCGSMRATLTPARFYAIA
jgi:hypothetical protein